MFGNMPVIYLIDNFNFLPTIGCGFLNPPIGMSLFGFHFYTFLASASASTYVKLSIGVKWNKRFNLNSSSLGFSQHQLSNQGLPSKDEGSPFRAWTFQGLLQEPHNQSGGQILSSISQVPIIVPSRSKFLYHPSPYTNQVYPISIPLSIPFLILPYGGISYTFIVPF